MKKLLLALLAFTPLLSFGAAGDYTLLAPFGNILSGTVSLSSYLQGIFQVTIGIGGVLAVIMLVKCGIELVGSTSPSAKSAAKECIGGAILGVFLGVASWVILNTINSDLLKNELTLGDIAVQPQTEVVTGSDDPMPTSLTSLPGWYFRYKDANNNTKNSRNFGQSGEGQCLLVMDQEAKKGVVIVDKCFQILPSNVQLPQGEVATRNGICGNDTCVSQSNSGVFINARACATYGEKGCTLVNGLGNAIDVVKNLKNSSGCDRVTITGGTEYWAHKTHAAGRPIVDVRKDACVNKFLNNPQNGLGRRASFTLVSGATQRVFWNNFWWTDEGDHWHACEANQPYWYCKDCIDKTCSKMVAPQ